MFTDHDDTNARGRGHHPVATTRMCRDSNCPLPSRAPSDSELRGCTRRFHRAPTRGRGRSPEFAEFPFNSGRKRITTVHLGDGGPAAAYVKGSRNSCSRGALRVLGVATRTVSSERPSQDEAEQDLVFLGLVGMLDTLRPERCGGGGFVSASHQHPHRVVAPEIYRGPAMPMIGRFDWARSDGKGPSLQS